MSRDHLNFASHRQRGFSLVAAIFLIVIVALIGVFIVVVGGVQSSIVSLAVQSGRAYQAARAGAEWATFRAITDNACPSSSAPYTPSFVLTATGLNGFNVSIECTATAHTESSPTPYNVYIVTSTAWTGTWGQPDFVQRRIQATITSAPATSP